MPSPAPPPETAKKLPATGLAGLMAVLGPGIVVAGSVIGAGELINTPIQAAKFGFLLLWAVILSCVIKYFLQVEIGRYCLVHRRTTVESLNHCPGPSLWGTSWIALVYMGAYTVSLASAVGIIGALAGLMHSLAPLDRVLPSGFPLGSTQLWGIAMAVLTALLLCRGAYNHLEKIVALLVGGFCISVVVALALIQRTEFRISGDDVLSGLRFSLGDQPRLAAYAVISLMGALGTTANELFMYPYWLLEKGYARDLPANGDAAWLAAMKRWVRGLYLDAGFATVLATVATVAFYLLGAAVLHRQGVVPKDIEVVQQVSQVFTQTHGAWSYAVFMAGAFCTLFSTLVVATAATGRMWSDVFCSLQVVDRANPVAVSRSQILFQLVGLAGMLTVFLLFADKPPAELVLFGQFFAGAVNLPLLLFGICWLAFHTDSRLRMKPWTAAALLITSTVIVVCVLLNLAIQQGWLFASEL